MAREKEQKKKLNFVDLFFSFKPIHGSIKMMWIVALTCVQFNIILLPEAYKSNFSRRWVKEYFWITFGIKREFFD